MEQRTVGEVQEAVMAKKQQLRNRKPPPKRGLSYMLCLCNAFHINMNHVIKARKQLRFQGVQAASCVTQLFLRQAHGDGPHCHGSVAHMRPTARRRGRLGLNQLYIAASDLGGTVKLKCRHTFRDSHKFKTKTF